MATETACDSQVDVFDEVTLRCERPAGHDGNHYQALTGRDSVTNAVIFVDVEW